MTLGLKKFENELKNARQSVIDDKDPTDWALFGYDGQSNDLNIILTGQYGLDELQQEFNPGKVLYAFAKVLNPKSNLPCFITISWVGEGSSLNRKSSSPNHSIEFQKFFKYSSLNINARLEEEVEPDAILDKIRKSSTTEFNFSIKTDHSAQERPAPVSTNHVRIRPEKDLNLKEKTKFWSKLEQEDQEKRQQELRKEKELKLNERNLISNRKIEVPANEVIKKIDNLKLNNDILNEREKFWEEEKAEEKKRRDEENRRRLLEKRKLETEIRSLTDAKQIMSTFNNLNPNNVNSNQVKKINAIDEINSEKKKVLSSIKNTLQNKENTEVNMQIEADDDDDDLTDEIVIHEDDENNRTFTVSKEQQQAQPNETEYYKLQVEYCGNNTNNSQAYSIDQRINEEDELYDEEYENEYCLDNGLTNYSYLSKRLSNEPLEDIAEEDEDLELQDDELQEYIKDKGKCARAIFPREAGDETEISFDTNDIITHIDQTYESWYTGRTKDNREGLFPANFVELLN